MTRSFCSFLSISARAPIPRSGCHASVCAMDENHCSQLTPDSSRRKLPYRSPPFYIILSPRHRSAVHPAFMPKRTDISSILVIGSGPIIIGQACEFDYSGTQACKALREEGFRIILVNSNPATIMTDPEFADRTYIEPLTPATLERIIERERPDAILPTVGGQTAINLAIALHESGALERFGVELIGAN